MAQRYEVTGIVLAGGDSRRMGTNKAMLMVDGVPLIERTVRSLKSICSRVLISTNTPDRYAFLGLECIQDVYERKGPMAGLHAALLASDTNWNVVAACDMPFIQTSFLAALLELADTTAGCEAVIPLVDGRYHPLLAVYHRSVGGSLALKLQHDELRMMSWISHLRTVTVDEERLSRLTGMDPRKVLFNPNARVDLEAAQVLIGPNITIEPF
ncbi:molybdenum cofactor guanylyltransferase [Peribacillus sp. NPDC056705]|uniref:molybdenum cofactor guanylyltransferase n=1 Tax=Peribacillus sp. NPDC056705 TaxID=3345918 RepID=UPI0037495A65